MFKKNTVKIDEGFDKNAYQFSYNIQGEGNLLSVKQCREIHSQVLLNFPKKFNPGKLSISIRGNNNSILIGSVKVEGALSITVDGDDNEVILSDNIFVKRNLDIFVRPGGPNIKVVSSRIFIGPENWFNGCVFLDAGEPETVIDIQSFCLFGNNIVLQTSDNHSIFDIENGKILNRAGNIFIDKHVWCCSNVTILNNSRIGPNSVVGTRSLVNKQFNDSNVVIAGVPARIVRKNISWSQKLFRDEYCEKAELEKMSLILN